MRKFTTLKVSRDLHARFRDRCRAEGRPMQHVVERFLELVAASGEPAAVARTLFERMTAAELDEVWAEVIRLSSYLTGHKGDVDASH